MEWVFLSLVTALAQVQPRGPLAFEIDASLSGYNLLWPSQRCCAFELHVSASGQATLRVSVSTGDTPTERRQSLRLNAAQMQRLKAAVAKARFFELPRVVGTTPVDGDVRKVRIRMGERSHEVEIGESALAAPPGTTALARAAEVWRAIRESVDIPEATDTAQPHCLEKPTFPKPLGSGGGTAAEFNELYETGQFAIGYCVAEAEVNDQGTVDSVRVVRPRDVDERVKTIVVRAIKSRRFTPARACGQPVPFTLTVGIGHCPTRARNR